MKGILVFFLLVGSASLVWSADPTSGIQDGWRMEADQSLSYIVQLAPQTLTEMQLAGEELEATIPEIIRPYVRQVVVRIGVRSVEREPSEAALLANPRMLPSFDPRTAVGPGALTSLNGRTGETVMIDPLRSSPPTIATNGTTRLSDAEAAAMTPPVLAQNTPGSRGLISNNFDPTRTAFNGSQPTTNANTNTVLPRQDSYQYSNSGFVGPLLPPGYTGGSVTALSSPITSPTPNSTYSPPVTTATGTTYNNASLANGNFGNANNYGYGTNSLATVPSLNYSNTTAPYGTATYANTVAPYSSNNPNTTYGAGTPNNFANPSVLPNGTPSILPQPNAYVATTAQVPNVSVNTAMPNNGYPSNVQYQNPQASAPMTVAYANQMQPPTSAAAAGYPTTGSVMANSAMGNSVPPRPSSINPEVRTVDDRGYRGEAAVPSPSAYVFMPAMLLLSIVANMYLLWLLNHLLQRYRSLQASARGTSSLAL